jgi:hypothetical protein
VTCNAKFRHNQGLKTAEDIQDSAGEESDLGTSRALEELDQQLLCWGGWWDLNYLVACVFIESAIYKANKSKQTDESECLDTFWIQRSMGFADMFRGCLL